MPSSTTRTKVFLFLSNGIIAYLWFRVFLVCMNWRESAYYCETIVRPRVKVALWVSCFELAQAFFRLTSSKPSQVFLFSSVRLFVELYVSFQIPCKAWQHEMTILCWSVGEVVRFSCFALDSLISIQNKNVRIFKTIRYEVSRILFPLGALSEVMLVLECALVTRRWEFYLVTVLWPVGFFPLMRRLLKQRSNHGLMHEKNVLI